MTEQLLIDRMSLRGLYPSTYAFLSPSLSNSLPLSFVSRIFYHLPFFAHVSRIYTSQPLRFFSSYPFLPLLLHSTFLTPSDQNSFTMQTPPSKIWTFFFTCLSCLDAGLEETEAEYREPMSFHTFADFVICKLETLGAAASPFLTDLVQLVVPGSDPDLHLPSAVRKKPSKKSNSGISQVLVASRTRPGEQH